MTTDTPFFEEEKASLSAGKVWTFLRRTFAFLLIFSMVSNDLAFAGRHDVNPGYSSDGEQQQHSPRRTPPSGSPLKRFNSSPDLTSYFSKTSLSSQTTSTRTPSEETLPHGSSSLGSSDESREQASSLKSSPEKDTIPSLGKGHEKKDKEGQSPYPSTLPILIKKEGESPRSLSPFVSEQSRGHLSNGSSTPVARKSSLSPEDERDAPAPLQGQERRETGIPRTSPLPVTTNGHASRDRFLQEEGEEIVADVPPSSLDDTFIPNHGSWGYIPDRDKVRMVPVTAKSSGKLERKPAPHKARETDPLLPSSQKSTSRTGSFLDRLTSGSGSIQEERLHEGSHSGLLLPDEVVGSTYSRSEEDEISRLEEARRLWSYPSEGETPSKPFFPKRTTFVLLGNVPTLLGFLPEAPVDEEEFFEGERSARSPQPHRDLSPLLLNGHPTDVPEKALVPVSSSLMEEGGLLPSGKLRATKLLVRDFDNFPPHVKAYLQHLTQRDLEGRVTKSDLLAYGLGTALGAGVAFAMVPVYNGGLDYMRDTHGWNFINDLFGGGSFFTTTDFYYIMPTLLFDTVPRNVSSLKRALTFLKEESGYKIRALGTMLAVALPSFTEPAYLITFIIYAMNKMDIHGWNNQFAIGAMVYCPFLYADSMMGNFEAAWELTDDIKEWASTSRSYVARHIPKSWFPDLRSPYVEGFQESLEKLPSFFQWCPPEQLDTIYETVIHAKQTLREQLPDLTPAELDTATGFFVTRYLIDLGNSLREGTKRAQSWMETLVDGTIYGTLAAGSPYRVLVPQVIVRTIVHLFASPLVSNIAGWTLAAVAFPIQTALEYKGMRSLTQEVVWEKDPSGHSSHTMLRTGVKAGALWQALVFTAPLMVLAFQATDLWLQNDWWMMMSIPYLLGEFSMLATQYNATYNHKVATAVTKGVHKATSCSKCTNGPCTECKRDQLSRVAKTIHKKIPSRSLDFLNKLHEVLQMGKVHDEESEED